MTRRVTAATAVVPPATRPVYHHLVADWERSVFTSPPLDPSHPYTYQTSLFTDTPVSCGSWFLTHLCRVVHGLLTHLCCVVHGF